MGVTLPLAGAVAVLGIIALFAAPWLGGAVLLAAVILGLIGIVSLFAKAGEAIDHADEPVESPHMPGPGNPESGVD